MSWLRIDDGFPQHPKLAGWTSAQKWALIELFTYCARHKTEGHVPNDLSLLPRAVNAGLLTLAEDSGILDRDEENGLVVHDWQVYNPSDATAADRMRRMRERNARRNTSRNASRNETVSSRARDPVPSPTPEIENSLTSTTDPARGNGWVDNLSAYTGCRYVRGTHALTAIHDPLGTERPPNDWPHERPTRAEILAALEEQTHA